MKTAAVNQSARRVAGIGVLLLVAGIAVSPLASAAAGGEAASGERLAVAFAVAAQVHDVVIPLGSCLVAAALVLFALARASDPSDG